VVGAAPLERGEARLVMRVVAASTGEIPVDIRYLPDAPWLVAGRDVSVLQRVRDAGAWKEALLLLAAAAVVLWTVATRSPGRLGAGRQSGRVPADPSRPISRSVAAVARVDLVRATESARCWTGVVTDAHDGTALAGARVSLERPGFQHVEVVAETVTDEGGAFVLPALDAKPGDELVSEGPIHAVLRRPSPPCGHLAIALAQRRRALLDRLVAWARRNGHAPAAPTEPTPGEIGRAAGIDPAVRQWATAVERAAYGGGVVDRRAEEEVERLAPDRRPEPLSRRR
ncbi:MAG: carboxypeptidase-like regulatory domain-containing protein, partial [Myxococcota bacterium]|nr:carboxypeptidase-like regulatory domain-containing protein [Myxococcota bacterium]